MEGHAKVKTFDDIGNGLATAPLLKQAGAEDGNLRAWRPRVDDRVWISYLAANAPKTSNWPAN